MSVDSSVEPPAKTDHHAWREQITWNEAGLIPAIAQSSDDGDVLMMAYMNAEALDETLATGYATYWSRSKQRLWRKGESSGHRQRVVGVYLDCDGDALLLRVEQHGGAACHTGRRSCFYRAYNSGTWDIVAPVLADPHAMYGQS